MTLQEIAAYHRTRWAKPWVLVSILALGAPVMLMKAAGLLPVAGRHPGAWLSTLVAPYLYSGILVWATPTPFLWTGRKRDYPPLHRGLLQALPCGLLLTAVIVLVDWALVRWAGVKGLPGLSELLLGNLVILVPLMMLLGFLFAAQERSSREKAKAEHQAREAQWILLRGQLSPHVLFNSLNGLAELVHTDPDAAEQAILDLAALYRALLDHGHRHHAPLGDERKLVARYLAVEALRLGPRLQVDWDWDPQVDPLIAPPFLVQPLVENALKHGIAPHPEGGRLQIISRREGRALHLQVRNTGRPLPLVPGDGVGVRNLEARLALAFEPDPKLRLYSDGPWTVAEIGIPAMFPPEETP